MKITPASSKVSWIAFKFFAVAEGTPSAASIRWIVFQLTPDTLKGIEVKKVSIAGDNETGFAVDSKLGEFVVAGIAARSDCVNDWDHLGDALACISPVLTGAPAVPCQAPLGRPMR